LEKDVAEQSEISGRGNEKTTFGIFVLHNKNKPKKGNLPDEIVKERYWAAETIPDLWVPNTSPFNEANWCSVSTLGRLETFSSIQRRRMHKLPHKQMD
jgi:hypoxanthine phosphoribosyltransferase